MPPSRGGVPSLPLLLPLLLFSILLLSSPLVLAAVSPSDLLAYVGSSATGQTLSTGTYDLTILANETTVLVSISWEGEVSDVGWLGMGVGDAMTDSDLVVLWPTISSSSVLWTLSHRSTTITTMPQLVSSPNTADPSIDSDGNFAVVAELSSPSGSESPAVVSFTRPLTMADGYVGNYQLEREVNQAVIYAVGTTNPGDSAQDTDIEQHDLSTGMGATYIDLSAAFSADSTALDAPLNPVKTTSAASTASGTPTATGSGTITSATTSTTSSGSSTATSSTGSGVSYESVIFLHGLVAGTTWAILAPTGALFARLARSPPPNAYVRFPWHFALQGWVVSPLTLLAVGLAVWATQLAGGEGESYTHRTVGLSLVAFLILQDSLGILKHFVFTTPGAGASCFGMLHILLGVSLVVGGFFQVHLGIVRYGTTSTLVTYGLYACIALFAFVYCTSLASCCFGRPAAGRSGGRKLDQSQSRRRSRKKRRASDSGDSDESGEHGASSTSSSSDGGWSSDEEEKRRRRRRKRRT